MQREHTSTVHILTCRWLHTQSGELLLASGGGSRLPPKCDDQAATGSVKLVEHETLLFTDEWVYSVVDIIWRIHCVCI